MIRQHPLRALVRCSVIAGLAGALAGVAPALASPPVHQLDILSPVYTVDGIYRSMKGPSSTREVDILPAEEPQLLWIVGYQAVMVGPDGRSPASQEFMCHSNLDFNAGKHRQLFGWDKVVSPRLFTLSQGQFAIRFPDGYGIPMMSNEPLSLTTQVLNLNVEDKTFEVRHKVTIDYVLDKDTTKPMKPLFQTAAVGLAQVDGPHGAFGMPPGEKQGESCLPGAAVGDSMYKDPFGRTFTGHWIVPPGRQVNRTLVTHYMNLPFDTTIHFIAVHLHPFAESLELRDLTTGETVFKSRARNDADKIGLAHVDTFASEEGIPIYKDHDYELVTVYDNTSDVDQDSMAVMYLYLYDKEFRRSDLAAAR